MSLDPKKPLTLADRLAVIRQTGSAVTHAAGDPSQREFEFKAADFERVRKLIYAHAVLCALAGLPAIYFHSWIGSEHWTEGPVLCGYNRAINRERPPVNRVETALADAASLRAMVHAGFSKMLSFRAAEPAFAPGSPQLVLSAEDSIFAILRGPDRTGRFALCLHNFSGKAILYKASVPPIPEVFAQGTFGAELPLGPHGTRWIAFGGDKKVAVLEI